jgi:hypothetical protein
LPFRAPEVLTSVVIGAALYYGLGALGLLSHDMARPTPNFPVGLPLPSLGFLKGMPIAVHDYLPLALPFAILTVIGGINVTESARIAGDDYNTRDILLTEAIATLVAGVCGGVSQTTPYIGHPAYKAMGGAPATRSPRDSSSDSAAYSATSRSWPTLYQSPRWRRSRLRRARHHRAELSRDAQASCGRRDARRASVGRAARADLSVAVYNGALMSAAIDPAGTMKATGIGNPDFIRTCAVMILLAHGFILTAMLWGGVVAFLIDRRITAAATTLAACAVLSFFGFIHSVTAAAGSICRGRSARRCPITGRRLTSDSPP